MIQGKHTFHALVFLHDVLTGAWEVDCVLVARVTSLLLRRVHSLAIFTAPILQSIGIVF